MKTHRLSGRTHRLLHSYTSSVGVERIIGSAALRRCSVPLRRRYTIVYLIFY